MRLLQINISVNVGSTSRIAEQIGLTAMRNGWSSYIAYGRIANLSKSNVVKIGSKIDLWYHALISLMSDKHGLGSRMATRRLIKQIKEIKPDIIHLHNIHGYYINYKILFEYLATSGIPVVWTLHDCWSFTGHCAHFVSVDCMKWKTQCIQCPLKHKYPKSLVDNSARNFRLKKSLFRGLRGNLTIVPVSNWLHSYVEDSFLQGHNIVTIHNGIDTTTFKQIEVLDSNDSTKIILGVASVWTKAKGLNDFILLRDMLPADVEIKLVGLTKEQIASLPSGVLGIERTRCIEDLVKLYSEADVFVNPTYADTFPTVNLEALACGTPVITYQTGGSPEAVTPETGIVVEQGNLEKLKDAIMTVLNNGKECYSQACRQRAEEHFDKNKCFQQYIDLYNEILSNK